MLKVVFLSASIIVSVSQAHATEPERFRDIACPGEWSVDSDVIPIITDSLQPWGKHNGEPVTESKIEADKAISLENIASTSVISTIDELPVTVQKMNDDLLTVASECLVFKNMVVDGEQYYPPAGPVEYRPEVGFIAASAF